MKKFLPLLPLILVILLILTTPVAAKDPLFSMGGDVIHGGPLDPGKAAGDTVLIMGPWDSDAAYNGQFETPSGTAAWNGWTHTDRTCSEDGRWTVSTYQADNLGSAPALDNLAAWCGYPWEACADDEEGGYGNDWHEVLEWRATVPNTGAATAVDWDFYINWDTELNYDFVTIRYLNAGGAHELADLDRDGQNVHQVFSFSYLGGDYAGDLGDEIILQIAFDSDYCYSDEDCLNPTVGACQVDDITVALNSSVVSFTDFADGTLGEWFPIPGSDCVGDFAMLRDQLGDVDPCSSNFSYQTTFIDDGIVVPGTGGSFSINWRYGPGGYIVTPDGGLAGPGHGISNCINSPVMAWPSEDYGGAVLAFDAYRHEDLDLDSPGIYYAWAIRSTSSANPADIENAGFLDRNRLFSGSPQYVREGDDVSDLLVSGRKFVQISIIVLQPHFDGGLDGYPAPYFDNVRLAAYTISGPAMRGNTYDMAQDVFPAKGRVDHDNLGENSCRFDMARSISPTIHHRNDPGDSIIVTIAAVRDGSMLHGDPQLVWKMKANPWFDAYRTSTYGTARQGVANGWNVYEDRFAFDLPDTGFLFPGDVLHYYIKAQDRVGGQDIGTTIMPADTSGFSDFSQYQSYSRCFVVHCLPSFQFTNILFWNDQGSSFGRERWLYSLSQIFGSPDWGQMVDVFETNAPAMGMGNGLGGRAGTVEAISCYDIILYSSGSETRRTLVGGDDTRDFSDDIGLLNDWLATGNKDLLLTGDNLVSDLVSGLSADAAQFAGDYLGLTYVYPNLRYLINNQYSPVVLPTPVNPVPFYPETCWLAYGDCYLKGGPDLATFDAVVASGVGQRLAEFTDPAGNTGVYPYSAATLAANPQGLGNRIVTLPYDLYAVTDDRQDFTKTRAPIQTRSKLLFNILSYFGIGGYFFESGTDLPGAAGQLAVQNQPNPFNPATELLFNMPGKGRLTLKIFNVRGELVRTLVDGMRPAGPGKERWDGTDNGGQAVAAGVYICEARALGQVQTSKMVIVR